MSRQVEMDLKALAEASARGLPTLDQTGRALTVARTQPTGGTIMSIVRKPLFASALAAAVTAAVLVSPVPYTRTVGYELTVTSAAGRVAKIRVPAKNAAQAERRAAELRNHGAMVAVAPRTERVWGSVYAMAKAKLLEVHVELDGKSDAQVADDIRAQLASGGWNADDVQVQRGAEGSTVQIDAQDGNGRQMKVVRKASAGDDKSMDFQLGGIDDAREPGMSDAQLRDKILQQLKARGLDAEVTVDGAKVQIRASRSVEQ
ncbi:MAG: hypothetical protein LC659_06160 [Myxococcales bacterium]|nr:hypothetical protein [Myxococcales bacterium]